MLDERDLAEEAAGQHRPDGRPRLLDPDRSIHDDEEGLAGIALLHQDLAGHGGPLPGQGRHGLDSVLVEVREQRHGAKQGDLVHDLRIRLPQAP
jgi:hypothetical protein